MRRELVFTARPGSASPAVPVTLADAGLRERSDLQEWVRAHPQILGDGVRIVTYEFDRWASASGNHADRLDLLGLGEDGRLVVAELKRDSAPDTVEMQAIKYAALAAGFSREVLGACHGNYLRRETGDLSLTDEGALARLDEHCGGLDDDKLAVPRIVLVAGSFPPIVMTAIRWLSQRGLDFRLVQINAYQCEHDLVITASELWPLPQAEDLIASPVAPRSKAPTGGTARQRSTTTAIASLAASGAIADGTELRLVPSGAFSADVTAWLVGRPEWGQAIWRAGQTIRALEWPVDSGYYSASGLAEHIVKAATGKTASLQGPDWWAIQDGTTLAQLAGTAPGSKDWTGLHALLDSVKPGEWTTYGDLAEVVASHPIAVGQHIARCEECANAWRVLGADGRPRPNFAWTDPQETRTCRQVLESEGVMFTNGGSADPGRRVGGEVLKARADAAT